MYPDWSRSSSDLVPLPPCDGPKLDPFDFRGPQKIKFLEHLGEGQHSHVFKVEILGCIHALKLFRFVYDDDWMGPVPYTDPEDHEAMTAFYNYSEPFSAECRAFGRLKEAGHEELAVRCFGYVLLDEEHERIMMEQFSDLELEFQGNADNPAMEETRSLFLGRDGRPPPIRGIVKAFGLTEEPLRATYARRILRDVIGLHQLGIIDIDVAHRQLVDGKLADLSIAITTPHYLTDPDLNPHLTSDWTSRMEREVFRYCLDDYSEFDNMVTTWNEENGARISTFAFPCGGFGTIPYNLRNKLARDRLFSYVDPRRYDWRAARKPNRNNLRRSQRGAVSKVRPRPLAARPPRWYYKCDNPAEERAKAWRGMSPLSVGSTKTVLFSHATSCLLANKSSNRNSWQKMLQSDTIIALVP